MRAHLTALFLAAAVIAAACGSGTDGADSLSTSNASSSAGDVSKTEPEPSGTSGETPLTASFRGVTATTIEIGIALVDFQQLVELGFIENSHGDERLIWNTLIDDLNASGGVGGRLLEPIFDSYVPFGSTQAEISCLRLTEDNAVFAVLGLVDRRLGFVYHSPAQHHPHR